MAPVTRVKLWLRAMVARNREDDELAREMASHIAMERDELIRQGVAPDEAERRARVAFGGVQRHTEAVRDERGTRLFGDLAQDIRFAMRYSARAPLVTGTIVALLAVAIGTNSIVFSLVDTLTLQQPAGVNAAPHTVRIRGTVLHEGQLGSRMMDYAELAEYRAHSETFEQVAGTVSQPMSVRTPGYGDETRAGVQFVTNGFFSLLRVKPALGAVLPAESDAVPLSSPSVVVSYEYWRRALGGSSEVIGKTITLDSIVATIAGVAPPGFTGVEARGFPTVAWVPYSALPSGPLDVRLTSGRQRSSMSIVARLRPGVSMQRANSLAQATSARLLFDGKPPSLPLGADVVPLRANNAELDGPKGGVSILAALGLVAFLILAIICSTVTALIVGRAVGRQREIGVRLSLGASRWRVVRQLLTECVMLALAGGALGLLLLVWLTRLSKQWIPEVPLTIGPLTVALTAALALGTSVLIGLSPALHATRQSVFGALKVSAGMSTWHTLAQRQLIVAQIALSQPLLVALGVLLVHALGTTQHTVDPDLAKRVVSMDLEVPRRVNTEAIRLQLMSDLERLTTQLAQTPGVERAAFGDRGTLRGSYQVDTASRIVGATDDASFASQTHPVSPGYFDVLNIHVTRGRDFDRTDVGDAPRAAIIGSDLARKLWGTANPIGRRLINECKCAGGVYTVVGVVDAAQAGPSLVDGRMSVYTAYSQYSNPGWSTLTVRVSRNPEPMLALLRERVRQELPRADIMSIETLAQMDARHNARNARSRVIASVGGVLALLLAAIGLYAVVSFSVGQRTREIGVRIALGASSKQVVTQFFANGVKLSLLGSAIGLPASAYVISSATFGMFMRNDNVWTVGAEISAAVTAVAMFATWIPARRAAHVDPMEALRAE